MPDFLSRIFRPGGSGATWIEIDELQRGLTEAEPVLLIDVRGPDEFNAPPGHLPGAVNIPLPELPTRIAEIEDQKKPVVLVCKTDRRSARAADILQKAGVPDVAVLRGGTDLWHERGLKLD
jgi:rhodanese-related sulfurtransferase